MAQYKVLVAEDDTVLRDLYLRKFDRTKYDVFTAQNGQETLDSIQKEKPDLVLLDINMPILDGFAVLEHFPKPRPFRVIVLTNLDDQANHDRGKKHEVDDYFIKRDMTVKGLMEMVDKVMGKTAT